MKKTWKRFVSTAMTAAMIVPGVLAPVSSMSAKAETREANREGVYSIDLSENGTAAPAPWGEIPSQNQYDYQKQELAAFCHFGMNTYTNTEWGNGKESPSSFALENDFDADNMIKSLQGAGFKKIIVTAKHHDGFCIWRSAYTDHDLESTNYEGDVLKEISAACTKYDMDMGLYLSPWDVNNPSYGYRDEAGNPTDKEHDVLDYNKYYNNQLQEILGNDEYGNDGHFVEVWMDGAKGDGSMAQDYDFDLWFDTIQKNEGIASKNFESDCMLFGAQSRTTVRWIGNESGFANEETWSKSRVDKERDTIDSRQIGGATSGYHDGNQWTVPEVDAKITSGWFWGPGKKTPLSLEQLSNMYFDSVGHGAVLLLNIPPNREGTIDQAILDRVGEFGTNIDETFKKNLAAQEGVTISASSVRGDDIAYSPDNLKDDNDDTYWTMDDGSTTGSITIDLGSTKTFDVVSIEEAIKLGQRVSSFTVEYQNQGGEWKKFAEGTTIGPKKLCRKTPVKADKVRINITGSYAVPVISEVGLYKASQGFEVGQAIPDGLDNIDIKDTDTADGIGFEIGSGWTQETGSQYTNGTNMWANPNAEVTLKFKGTKAWLLGTQDPNHGTADLYIDGATTPVTINTSASKRAVGQVLYETPDLEDGLHTIRLVVKNKAIGLEAALALNNGGKGMFELEQTAYTVPEDTVNEFVVKRIGGSKGRATVLFQDNPGTAVQSDYIPTEGIELVFEEGETEKTAHVTTKRQTLNTGDVYFSVDLVEPSDGTVLGFKPSARVTITDADKITKEMVTELIASTDSLVSAYYKEDSWNAMLEAKKEAQKVVDNESATGVAVTNAYNNLKAAIDGLVSRDPYTEEDPFAFPAYKDQTKLLEAEFFALDPIAGDKYVRITESDQASNGKEVNWFEPGNKIILHYTAEKAGTYNLEATYRSGRTQSNPNAFVWSGDKIESGNQDVYGEDGATQYHKIVLPIKITEAGAGTLIFTADAKAGPVIDKFEITPNEIDYVQFQMDASAGDHGSISDPGETNVYQGTDKKFVITPEANYKIDDVLVNGESVKDQLVAEDEAANSYSYTFVNIQENNTIEASFVFDHYTEAVPFAFPSDESTANLEAEHFTLYPVNTDKYVRISDNTNASNGKEINWFEAGNVIKLPFTAEQAGTYTLTATYRSGRTQSSPNAFVWSGTNVVSGNMDVYGPDANVYKTVELPVVVTKAGAGELVLTADSKAGPVIDKFDVQFTAPSTPVESVVLDQTSATLTQVGETLQLNATVAPENATNKNVTWESSNPAAATVDENGTVTAVATGTAKITVTTEDGNKTAECEVTVGLRVTGITFDVKEKTLTAAGETFQLNPVFTPQDAMNKKLSWKSTNENAATVDQSGLVTAAATGNTEIIAITEDGGFVAACRVNVEIPVKAEGVTLDRTTAEITTENGNIQLTATVNPENATNKNVSWESSEPGVAAVDGNGLVTAVSDGPATITVTTEDGGFTAQCEVTVAIVPEVVPVEGITMDVTEHTMQKAGETLQLKPQVQPSNASNQKVTYHSSNPEAATVDENGCVTAIANGDAVITVTTEDGGFGAVCNIKVAIPVAVTDLTLDKKEASLTKAGETLALEAAVMPENATNKNVTWISTMPEVADVDQGVVTAVADGTTTIIALTEDGHFTATCQITVSIVKPVTGISLNETTLKFSKAGATAQLKAAIAPADATNKNVTWTSSDSKVAEVDQNGVVTAAADGKAIITVKSEDGAFMASCETEVKIDKPVISVTGVSLNKTSAVLYGKGAVIQLEADVYPENAANKKVTWSSKDKKVAKVDSNGKVTAVSNGKTDIIVKTADGNITAKCTITVKDDNKPAVVIPGRVTNVKVSDQAKHSMKVTWNNVKGADTYRVYVYNQKIKKWSKAGTTGETGMTIKRLPVGMECQVKVAAVNKAGKGAYSTAVTTATKPNKVTLKSVKKTADGSAKLTFSNVRSDGFAVYMKAGKGKYKKVDTVKTTTAVVNKLKKGTTYSFKVRAYVKADGKTYYGKYSNEITFKVK
ncbi:Ig-like domain-containing protein [uncultured Robinsoniella sp.]|uniref:Ig-like domain-containing protein n=1 Tax=uncultured Robinsoniella sp. TaxID=904190 RepID=UPI00374F9215